MGTLGDPPVGCEHVLTSATNLVDGDPSGFVRPDALLVLVLLTDVDDYGAYDQQGGNTCGIGCATPPPPLADLYDALVEVKGGAPEGVAAVVVAGDPGVLDGLCSRSSAWTSAPDVRSAGPAGVVSQTGLLLAAGVMNGAG